MPDRRLFLMATLSTAAAPVIARTSNAQPNPFNRWGMFASRPMSH
jgi:hypothetical protein